MSLKEHIIGVSHIGIPVENTEAAVEQYRALGFELQEMFFIPGSQRRAAFIRGNGCTLEVYESITAGYHGVIDHLALAVDDMEATLKETEALGLPMLYGGTNGVDEPTWFSRFFTVQMPGGEKVEFNMRKSIAGVEPVQEEI